jgi:DNA-directed RNA polymerase specialized sigma24 family protein
VPEISETEVEQQLRKASEIVDTAYFPHDDLYPTKVLSWLDCLEADDAALVRARIEGARWKLICWRFGISRATAHRRWRRSLRLIRKRLQEGWPQAG